jgi:hypothetical protein
MQQKQVAEYMEYQQRQGNRLSDENFKKQLIRYVILFITLTFCFLSITNLFIRRIYRYLKDSIWPKVKFINRGEDDYFDCPLHRFILEKWSLPPNSKTQTKHDYWGYILKLLKEVLRERRNTISSAIKKTMISMYAYLSYIMCCDRVYILMCTHIYFALVSYFSCHIS